MRPSGAVLLLICMGCLQKPPIVTPCPPPPVVDRPMLKAPSLSPDATIVEVLEAYVLDAIVMHGYSRKLESLLDAYRPAPKPKPPEAPK